MFTREEFSRFTVVLRVEPNLIEIECRCTLRRYGDSYGKLKVFTDGKLEIDCRCYPDCPKVEFAKHIGKNTNMGNWKNHLWLMDTEGNKVSLAKTNLLRYHTQTFQRPQRRPYVRRDEFTCCSKCNKERLFSLRTKEQCRIHHDALLKQDWQCSDMPQNRITCDDAEEHQSRKPCRGCIKKSRCKGCIRCVCVGCRMCRFEDCQCRLCTDFMQNKQS